jgi:hypothetical protein
MKKSTSRFAMHKRSVTRCLLATASLLCATLASATAAQATSPTSSTNSNGEPGLIWITDPTHPLESSLASKARVTTMAAAPAAVWGACSASSAVTKQVTTFHRRSVVSRQGVAIGDGTSVLQCGNSSFGYNHIYLNHKSQWEQKAALTNNNWRDIADLSMREGLDNPNAVTYRSSNQTFCFSRHIYLYRTNDNTIVGTMDPQTIIAQQDGKVITSYPSTAPC